jgi:hypothetical protein
MGCSLISWALPCFSLCPTALASEGGSGRVSRSQNGVIWPRVMCERLGLAPVAQRRLSRGRRRPVGNRCKSLVEEGSGYLAMAGHSKVWQLSSSMSRRFPWKVLTECGLSQKPLSISRKPRTRFMTVYWRTEMNSNPWKTW